MMTCGRCGITLNYYDPTIADDPYCGECYKYFASLYKKRGPIELKDIKDVIKSFRYIGDHGEIRSLPESAILDLSYQIDRKLEKEREEKL